MTIDESPVSTYEVGIDLTVVMISTVYTYEDKTPDQARADAERTIRERLAAAFPACDLDNRPMFNVQIKRSYTVVTVKSIPEQVWVLQRGQRSVMSRRQAEARLVTHGDIEILGAAL